MAKYQHALYAANGVDGRTMRAREKAYIGSATSNPTALLHLHGGTSTAGSAPLKIAEGTLLATPEDGAIEYSNEGLYHTRGTTRQELATKSFSNRVTVCTDPTRGNFTTIASAVAWFNASATAHTEILLDAGHHSVAGTITINNGTYSCQIRGLGSSVTFVYATSALSNAAMFDVRSFCDFHKLTLDGSAATGACTAILFGSTAEVYSEMTDIMIYSFSVGVADLIGCSLFIYNFVMSACGTGVLQNYSTAVSAPTMLDVEMGNFESCTKDVHLVKGSSCNVVLMHLVFVHAASPPATAITYVGGDYVLASIFNVFDNCTNNVGTFRSGFDFTLASGRDADVEFIGNMGTEDMKPHLKINMYDGTTTTTTSGTVGTYVKLNGMNSMVSVVFDVAATAGTYTISVGNQTTSALQYNDSAATIKTAIDNLSNVTSVAVVQLVASKEWTIEFQTSGEGWVDMPVTYNIAGVTSTTAVSIQNSYYTKKWGITNNRITYLSNHGRDVRIWLSANFSVGTNNRDVTLGVRKNGAGAVISPFTCRTTTAGIAYPMSLVAYLSDVVKNDYFELWVACSAATQTVRMWDLTLYAEAL